MLTTSGADCDKNSIKMKTFPFQLMAGGLWALIQLKDVVLPV